jgi:choline-sulfatase
MKRNFTRRQFLQTSAMGTTGALALRAYGQAPAILAGERKPNFLFIFTDQQNWDALSAHGNPWVKTPNLDRLVKQGVSFCEAHSSSPVCSPARSSFFTGRMPVETGVISNDRPINPDVPVMGRWFRESGYDTYYSGKWHLPEGYAINIDGFTCLPASIGQGDILDSIVSRNCQSFLRNRKGNRPFLLAASLLQPHDICYWAIKQANLVPKNLPFPLIKDQLPSLPPNHRSTPPAPAKLAATSFDIWSDEQWQYYLYCYYRMVEMADAEIGRILDALEDSGLAENTIVVFSSDHGEGAGRHLHVQKWYPYDEAMKIPFILSCPDRFQSDVMDKTHLVSQIDVMPTLCDFAGIATPDKTTGSSLRPLLEGKPVEWRASLMAETQIIGRILRTADYKYVHYQDDPIEQLFDMKNDPWEMTNLYEDAAYASVLEDHRKLLAEWRGRMNEVPPSPSAV